VPNFKSVALFVLEICLRECQILEGSHDLGHVPFVHFHMCILETLSMCIGCAKFQGCSCTHFGDMFEGVPNFIRVTWPRCFIRFKDMFEGVPNFRRVM